MTEPSHQASDPAAAASPPSERAFVVVNLDEAAEASTDLKQQHPSPKYGSLGDDVELGHPSKAAAPKHVSHSPSKDDADAAAADGETVCRVCHLGLASGNSESLVLGCACKQDLALCHRDCAEEWFKLRGNTVCEICWETAKNVRIAPMETTTAARRATVVAMAGTGSTAGGAAGEAENGTLQQQQQATTISRLRYNCWQRQLVRNALLVALVVVCSVPWFFRVVKEMEEPYASFHLPSVGVKVLDGSPRYLWTNQLLRNSLIATMIVVFMVPWFFRIAYF